MNRRGFFASLRGVLKPRSDGDPLFFGFQSVINVYGEDELRSRLQRIIAEAKPRERAHDKRDHYKRVAAVLRENVASIEYGYWDIITDPDDAGEEFDAWVRDIEASTATVGEELGEDYDDAFRLSNEKDYVVVTVLFLLEHGAEHQELVEMINAIDEDESFTPLAFQRLVDAVNYIDFERCQADAVFLLPGSDEDGFSWTDMRAPGWEYLRPVIGSL